MEFGLNSLTISDSFADTKFTASTAKFRRLEMYFVYCSVSKLVTFSVVCFSANVVRSVV